MRRSTGRTNISNETKADTGLPGSVKIGVLSGPIVPKPCGIPGCIATRSNETVPMRPSASLTTSYAPTLTPPVVITRSARISWSSIVVMSVLGSSGTKPIRYAVAPAAFAAAASMKLFESGILPAGDRLAGLDQLAAGGHDDDAGAGAHEHAGPPDRCQQRELRRTEPRPRRHDEVASLGVLALEADVGVRLRPPRDRDTRRCRRRSTRPARRRPRRLASDHRS